MMLRLQNYSFKLEYKPGTQVVIADTLSRAFPPESRYSESQEFNENLAALSDLSIELQQTESIQLLIASDSLKTELVRSSQRDSVVAGLRAIIQNGWPEKPDKFTGGIASIFQFPRRAYHRRRNLFKGNRIFVPVESRPNVLERIHSSHIGLQGCIRRARESLFWIGMVRNITKIVTSCSVCAKVQNEQSKEPLLSHELPDRP